jgi:very-short-patch-repair endonuclease
MLRALRDDCRRYDELLLVGWRVVRFAWEHVVLDPAWVRDLTRDEVDEANRGATAA